MDKEIITACRDVGRALRTLAAILETGATVEGKKASIDDEAPAPKKGNGRAATAAEPAEEKTVISVRSGKKAAAKAEEEFDLGGEAESEADEEKAVTKADLIAACRDNREAAIKVLKKMKVNSIHDLKPPQYAKVLAEIGA